MVTYVREIGKGHTALDKFSMIVNSHSIDITSYNVLFDKLHKASGKQANSNMSSAASEIKNDTGEDTIVSVDGSWQRRGHSSRNGVVTAISVVTGKVLDTEVLSSYCRVCDSNTNTNPEHDCQLNQERCSGAMEPAGAVAIFGRSIETRGLRYTDYLGDGDTSAYNKVRDSKPYGEETIL